MRSRLPLLWVGLNPSLDADLEKFCGEASDDRASQGTMEGRWLGLASTATAGLSLDAAHPFAFSAESRLAPAGGRASLLVDLSGGP